MSLSVEFQQYISVFFPLWCSYQTLPDDSFEPGRTLKFLIPFFLRHSRRNAQLEEENLSMASLCLLPHYFSFDSPKVYVFHLWPFYGVHQQENNVWQSIVWPLIRWSHQEETERGVIHSQDSFHFFLYASHRLCSEDSFVTPKACYLSGSLPPKSNILLSFLTFRSVWKDEFLGDRSVAWTLFLWHETIDRRGEFYQKSWGWLFHPSLAIVQHFESPVQQIDAVTPFYHFLIDSKRQEKVWLFGWLGNPQVRVKLPSHVTVVSLPRNASFRSSGT